MMWKRHPVRRHAAVAAVLVAVVGAGAPAAIRVLVNPSWADEDEDEGSVEAPSRVTVQNGIVTLTLDAAARQNAGIQTEPVRAQSSASSVPAYGTILDAAALTALDSRFMDARAQLRTAQAKLTVARAAYDRAKALYKDRQNISAAQLQAAEGAFEADQASLGAAQSRLATVTATALQAWGPVLGQAMATKGPLIDDLIERRAYLVKVTLSPDTAVAQAPERATALLAGGSRVPLSFVSPATATNPALQGMSYFYTAPPADGVLPGLNIAASLPTARMARGVVVPESAVVWLQGKAWVYLRTKADTFVRRAIQPDQTAPDGGYVVADLRPGTRVVVIGAEMLLSEEFRAQIGRGGDQD